MLKYIETDIKLFNFIKTNFIKTYALNVYFNYHRNLLYYILVEHDVKGKWRVNWGRK